MGSSKKVLHDGRMHRCVAFAAVSEQQLKNFKQAFREFEATKDTSATNLPMFTKKWVERDVAAQDKLTYLVDEAKTAGRFGSDDASFVEAIPVFAVRQESAEFEMYALSDDEIYFIENYTSALRSSTDKPCVRRRFGKTSKPNMLNSVLSYESRLGKEIKFPMYPVRLFPLTSVWINENRLVENCHEHVSRVDASSAFAIAPPSTSVKKRPFDATGQAANAAPTKKARPASSTAGNDDVAMVRSVMSTLRSFYSSAKKLTGPDEGASFDHFCAHVGVDPKLLRSKSGLPDPAHVASEWKRSTKLSKAKKAALEQKMRDGTFDASSLNEYAACVKEISRREHTIDTARALGF
jgi:hypothetical protein